MTGRTAGDQRNLVLLHLESIAWQAVHAFPEAFPNLRRLMAGSRVFRSYFASASSTQMVLGALVHANDFEFDANPHLDEPAGNNPGLFALLSAAGYRTQFLCATSAVPPRMLPLLANCLPPIRATDDYRVLLAQFREATARGPFAVYVWNLVTHIEHASALASYAEGSDDVLGGACAVADHVLGELLAILDQNGRSRDTAVIVFGDHGDDFWTHGFKSGQLHGIEPYAPLIHCPLAIRDGSLAPGEDHRLASTIDIAPSCFDLIGLRADLPFPGSGSSLLRDRRHAVVFSQNYTATQPDDPEASVRRAFATIDQSHLLLASSAGLELYNYRLDPGNHCNLLHFFDLGADGGLHWALPAGRVHPHFTTAVRHFMADAGSVDRDFRRLRDALAAQVARKHAYVAERMPDAAASLGTVRFDRASRAGRDAFFA
ncbi:hypothetical protein STAQ_25510 [Allostella sp. ATCC 35155]|nr:hypothetical protein STAQ_25510 [Stella sp. ATCC 35155]